MNSIKTINKLGSRAKGRAERIKCLHGGKLTRQEAILAHCYDCTGGYTDGARDCESKGCSLYPYHPYAGSK